MDFIIYIILMVLGACIGGFMAGLLGVGGGIILSPIQYFLLLSYGVDSSVAISVAFATSLAVIFVTMINSTYQHYNNGDVEFSYIKPMLLFGFVGAIIGAFISVNLDVSVLKVLFGFMCLGVAVSMILVRYPDDSSLMSSNVLSHAVLGLVAGFLCGLLGVGGGIIMIPVLTIVLKYPTHKAVGTSSASIIATSLGGVISYIVLGWNVEGLPLYSIGYVNLLQFVVIATVSSIVSVYAARISGRVDSGKLRVLHIILVFYIGLTMSGII